MESPIQSLAQAIQALQLDVDATCEAHGYGLEDFDWSFAQFTHTMERLRGCAIEYLLENGPATFETTVLLAHHALTDTWSLFYRAVEALYKLDTPVAEHLALALVGTLAHQDPTYAILDRELFTYAAGTPRRLAPEQFASLKESLSRLTTGEVRAYLASDPACLTGAPPAITDPEYWHAYTRLCYAPLQVRVGILRFDDGRPASEWVDEALAWDSLRHLAHLCGPRVATALATACYGADPGHDWDRRLLTLFPALSALGRIERRTPNEER